METGMKAFVREKLMTLTRRANRFTSQPDRPAKTARRRGPVCARAGDADIKCHPLSVRSAVDLAACIRLSAILKTRTLRRRSFPHQASKTLWRHFRAASGVRRSLRRRMELFLEINAGRQTDV